MGIINSKSITTRSEGFAMDYWKLDIGATVVAKEIVKFKVWAPKVEQVSVKIISNNKTKEFPLKKGERGYFEGKAEEVYAGDRYVYRLDGKSEYPDPASRSQPDGVHRPSQIIDGSEFPWEDNDWKGIPLNDLIIYELHTGTFTTKGSFEEIILHLDYLKELGITAIELMPVAQFPGNRNWGYDGVYPYAPQNSYGGHLGLKRIVDASHHKGIAVILDVVYNHLGPEGNYLNNFGPYFTDKYKTPWGDAVNFDGHYSDEVRHFFIANALYWITEYHIDALRIDAIHGIFDFSARHFLQDLGTAIRDQAEKLKRNVYCIVESDLNDVRVINPVKIGGYGIDAQWNDDFHHSLHTLITGEKQGYYEDFGRIECLEKSLREGYVYSGEYSPFRKRRHGSSSKERPSDRFIIFSQNHDQVGNRMLGDRLSQSQSFEKLKLAAGAVILSPFIPLLFMGEEYGEISPFQYFVSHSDDLLVEAVRKGRKEEFAAFGWKGEIPDPQAETTFLNSKIKMDLRHESFHKDLFKFYRELIRLRKEVPALCHLSKENIEVKSLTGDQALIVRRWYKDDETLCIYNFNEKIIRIESALPDGIWEKMLDSSSEKWGGRGSLTEKRIESKGNEILTSLNQHSLLLYRRVK